MTAFLLIKQINAIKYYAGRSGRAALNLPLFPVVSEKQCYVKWLSKKPERKEAARYFAQNLIQQLDAEYHYLA